ncbi:MAG: hypothetical protein IJR54_05250 [Oscillibacter sp.]|nr:hypothetical protein [Oscillibacter sp.]
MKCKKTLRLTLTALLTLILLAACAQTPANETQQVPREEQRRNRQPH